VSKPPEEFEVGPETVARRVPIERQIDLRFPTFEGLVTTVSANLSISGMFIRSEAPEAAGTEFSFALRIEEWRPIQGTAKVIWTRSDSEGPERPAGMGVQFLDLDAQSRRMIRWLVDKHLHDGGKPFDLDLVPAGASKYGGKSKRKKRSGKELDKSKTESADERSRGSLTPRNRTLLIVLALAILAAAAFGTYWMWFQIRPGGGSRTGSYSAGGRQPGRTPGTGGSDPTAEPIQAEVDAVTAATVEEVTGFIQSWTDAWEARDTAGVIAHYAEDFDDAAHGGRRRWESDIRQQLESSEFVRVAISALEISVPTTTTADATFFRSFRSNARDESGRWQLELAHTADGWKIRSERALD